MRSLCSVSTNTTAAVGLIGGLGLCGTGLTYVLYYYIVTQTTAVFASAVTYLPPLAALALGHLPAHESLVPPEIVAVLVISCGVALTSGNPVVSAAEQPDRVRIALASLRDRWTRRHA